MKSNKMPTIIFIISFGLYLLISNTLKANNAPRWMFIFSWIPIIVSIVYESKIIFSRYINKNDEE